MRITDARDIPASVSSGRGASAVGYGWCCDRLEEGAVIWAVVADGDVDAVACVIEAGTLPGWYVPLARHDKIVYAVVTRRDVRGCGIAPALVRTLLTDEARPGCEIYLDCMHWNSPARRAFEKIGFVPVATTSGPATQPAKSC